jgi:hypothetical protein
MGRVSSLLESRNRLQRARGGGEEENDDKEEQEGRKLQRRTRRKKKTRKNKKKKLKQESFRSEKTLCCSSWRIARRIESKLDPPP